MTLALALLVATATTSTAATWRDAAVAWEVAAETERADHRVTGARLEAEAARADAAEAAVDLVLAKKRAELAAQHLEVHRWREEAESRVSRFSRAWATAGGAACAAGVVAAVLGLALCDGAECRQVLGAGGAAVGAAGCVVLGVTW